MSYSRGFFFLGKKKSKPQNNLNRQVYPIGITCAKYLIGIGRFFFNLAELFIQRKKKCLFFSCTLFLWWNASACLNSLLDNAAKHHSGCHVDSFETIFVMETRPVQPIVFTKPFVRLLHASTSKQKISKRPIFHVIALFHVLALLIFQWQHG